VIAQTRTSDACAVIKTETVATMIAIKNIDGDNACCVFTFRATPTTAVITNAWIVMLQTLAAAATRNWRSMFISLSIRCWKGSNAIS
jgi:hypothetical protein